MTSKVQLLKSNYSVDIKKYGAKGFCLHLIYHLKHIWKFRYSGEIYIMTWIMENMKTINWFKAHN